MWYTSQKDGGKGWVERSNRYCDRNEPYISQSLLHGLSPLTSAVCVGKPYREGLTNIHNKRLQEQECLHFFPSAWKCLHVGFSVGCFKSCTVTVTPQLNFSTRIIGAVYEHEDNNHGTLFNFSDLWTWPRVDA